MVPCGPSALNATAVRKPSSRKSSASLSLSCDAGRSIWVLRAMIALRRRARKSAMGSVMVLFLPARLHETGDLALERQAAEAQAAHVELAHVGPAAAANRATVPLADLPLLIARDHLTKTSHRNYLASVA